VVDQNCSTTRTGLGTTSHDVRGVEGGEKCSSHRGVSAKKNSDQRNLSSRNITLMVRKNRIGFLF